MKTLLAVLGSVAGLLLIGAVYEAGCERRDRRRFPAPGTLVDVGGHRLHLHVMGEHANRPTVVMDAGMVSFSANWAWVQPAVARITRVVAVDRAGLGWSDPGPGPRDAGRSARELHAALDGAGIHGPYVLVGHSYGGFTSLVFAALHPRDVAGVVLVDGSHPEQWARFGFSSRLVGCGTAVGAVLGRFGVFRFVTGEYARLADGLPHPQHEHLTAFASTPRALATASSAALVWDAVSRPLVGGPGCLGDVPLVVLSVTDQPRRGPELTELQDRLARLSTTSEHVVVEGAYHEGLVARPEFARIVSQKIIEVVEAVAATGAVRPEP